MQYAIKEELSTLMLAHKTTQHIGHEHKIRTTHKSSETACVNRDWNQTSTMII